MIDAAQERERVLREFEEGFATVLMASDVAARGLDIPRASFVNNFDLPTHIDDYVSGAWGGQGEGWMSQGRRGAKFVRLAPLLFWLYIAMWHQVMSKHRIAVHGMATAL